MDLPEIPHLPQFHSHQLPQSKVKILSSNLQDTKLDSPIFLVGGEDLTRPLKCDSFLNEEIGQQYYGDIPKVYRD